MNNASDLIRQRANLSIVALEALEAAAVAKLRDRNIPTDSLYMERYLDRVVAIYCAHLAEPKR